MKQNSTAKKPFAKQLAQFEKTLEKSGESSPSGPFFPPVLNLALEIESLLREGKTDLPTLGDTVQAFALRGVVRRGHDAARRLGDCAAHDNDKTLTAAIRAMTRDEDGAEVAFDSFRNRIEKIFYAFVFTAHPTFSMSRAQGRALAAFAARPENATQETLLRAFEKPFTPPDLDEETAHALEAIGNLRHGIERLRRIALDVAEEVWPDRWTALRPVLTGVATWVGFDLDGRNDIAWTGVLARRFLLQKVQLEHYHKQLSALASATMPPAAATAIKDALRRIDTTLTHLQVHYRFFSDHDPDRDPGHRALQKASREMVSDAKNRLTGPEPLIASLEKALGVKSLPPKSQKDLAALLATLKQDGLTPAEVHFRLNAAQIHNAIRKHVDLATHPADPRFRQAYMDRLLRRFRKIKPAQVHFGSVLEEQASARRMFMLIQQIVKHIDGHSPIRFLIAETESSLTVMAALFLARRFGVEDHVDICPLFETERALERGSRIVEHLLDVPEFVNYIRKRGRLCIQTGYSDAGRYIGQSAAAGSIERLKERILRLMDARGMQDVALLFFDTHGESLGRGGHPDGFAARMDYVAPPALRRSMAERNMTLIQESSWQGGDGFLWFMTEKTAQAVLTRIMTHWIGSSDTKRTADDPAYGAERTATTEFLTIATAFQTDLMASPDYGALLSAFGPNLMRPTGSRAMKRQHEGRRGETRHFEAREFRAIPHNAIAAQMGMLINSVSGLGLAASADPAFFERMMNSSPRFSNVMAIALRAAALSDIRILESYISTLDPALWLRRDAALSETGESGFAESCAAVAQHLESHSPFEGLLRVFRNLNRDDTAFRRVANRFIPGSSPEDRTAIACLHAIRLGLIHRIFAMAMEIPNYSPMHDIPRSDLIELVFRLEIPTVMHELDEIFPVRSGKAEKVSYGEESNYTSEDRESYAVEHARIFRPIREMYALIQDISAALVHYAGFVG